MHLAFRLRLYGCYRVRWDPLVERPASLDLLAEAGLHDDRAIHVAGAAVAREWVDEGLQRKGVLTLPVKGELILSKKPRGRLTLTCNVAPPMRLELMSAASETRLAPHWLTWSGALLRDREPVAQACFRYDAKRDLLSTLRSLHWSRPRSHRSDPSRS